MTANMVLEERVELTRGKTSQDLKPWASTSSATPAHSINKVVIHLGIEPRTLWLKVKCSTAELVNLWLGWRGSNHRIIESKSIALPLGYSPKMVGREGVEPTKPEGAWSTVRSVWPLRYLPSYKKIYINLWRILKLC